MLRAPRKTQPAARRPGLTQITRACGARRGGGRAAPQKTPQPASRRIRVALNQERDVASRDAARDKRRPPNEKKTLKSEPAEASLGPSPLRKALPGSPPALGKVVTVTPRKRESDRGRAGLGTCCRRRGRPTPPGRRVGAKDIAEAGKEPRAPPPHTAIPPSAGQQSAGVRGDLNSARQPTSATAGLPGCGPSSPPPPKPPRGAG